MNTNHNVEEKITQALLDKSQYVSVPPTLKQRVDQTLDQRIMEGNMKRKWSLKKSVILIAVCCLLLSMGAFASGKVAGLADSMIPDKTYDSYSDIDKAQKYAEINFDSVESFSNGYQFTSMIVSVVDEFDEDYNTIGRYKEWTGEYALDSEHTISLHAYPTLDEDTDSLPSATKSINGIEVGFYVNHYKFVPADYELTEEDKANEAKNNYYISYGSSEVEECDYTSVSWQKDGISYFFQDKDTELSQEDLFQMAEEVIINN